VVTETKIRKWECADSLEYKLLTNFEVVIQFDFWKFQYKSAVYKL